jgi:NTP pyrophosphatase (non-canonical NTP hydrolase)
MEQRQFEHLRQLMRQFRDERGWSRYHRPKDLAVSVAIEAAELMELFQWRAEDETARLAHDAGAREPVAEEMADVLWYLVSLADVLNVDLFRAAVRKMEKNRAKYPAPAVAGAVVAPRRQ